MWLFQCGEVVLIRFASDNLKNLRSPPIDLRFPEMSDCLPLSKALPDSGALSARRSGHSNVRPAQTRIVDLFTGQLESGILQILHTRTSARPMKSVHRATVRDRAHMTERRRRRSGVVHNLRTVGVHLQLLHFLFDLHLLLWRYRLLRCTIHSNWWPALLQIFKVNKKIR